MHLHRPTVHRLAEANRWRNSTILVAMLVLRWCEQAADGLCVDPSLDPIGGDAGGCSEPGRCAGHCARWGCTLEYKCCNHTIAARRRVQAGVCSAEVRANIDESLHNKGLCDALCAVQHQPCLMLYRCFRTQLCNDIADRSLWAASAAAGLRGWRVMGVRIHASAHSASHSMRWCLVLVTLLPTAGPYHPHSSHSFVTLLSTAGPCHPHLSQSSQLLGLVTLICQIPPNCWAMSLSFVTILPTAGPYHPHLSRPSQLSP